MRVPSAEALSHILDGSVDLVLTDPPYFDNIAYSELADFFHPWLRHLGLISAPEIPGFPAAQLAAASRNDAGAASDFKARLAACFRETARTMKPGVIGAFTYQHTTAAGWLMLAEAMTASPLRVVNAFPLPGDTVANLHANLKASVGTQYWCCARSRTATANARLPSVGRTFAGQKQPPPIRRRNLAKFQACRSAAPTT